MVNFSSSFVILASTAIIASTSAAPFYNLRPGIRSSGSHRVSHNSHDYNADYNKDYKEYTTDHYKQYDNYNSEYFPPCYNSHSYEKGTDGYRYGYESGKSCMILEDYCKVYGDKSHCKDYEYKSEEKYDDSDYQYKEDYEEPKKYYGARAQGTHRYENNNDSYKKEDSYYSTAAKIVLKLEKKSYDSYSSHDSIKVETGGSEGCFGVDAGGDFRIKEILEITHGFGVFFYTDYGCVRATRIDDGKPPVSHPGEVSENVNEKPVKSLRLVAV